MLSPVTVATAEAAGVGDFINSDTIDLGSRATGNAYLEFMYVYVCVCVCVCLRVHMLVPVRMCVCVCACV